MYHEFSLLKKQIMSIVPFRGDNYEPKEPTPWKLYIHRDGVSVIDDNDTEQTISDKMSCECEHLGINIIRRNEQVEIETEDFESYIVEVFDEYSNPVYKIRINS